jgi:hypothetical protein
MSPLTYSSVEISLFLTLVKKNFFKSKIFLVPKKYFLGVILTFHIFEIYIFLKFTLDTHGINHIFWREKN